MNMLRILTLAANAALGLVTVYATFIVLSPAGAAFHVRGGDNSALNWAFKIGAVAVLVLVALAPTIRRGFGRAFLIVGCALLVLPISAFLLTGRAFVETVDVASPASVVGAGLGAGLITAAASVIGLIFGAIFLIAGLVLSLGGRREVIVIDRRVTPRPDPVPAPRASERREPPLR